jgi:L-alanine-DL-glutamate epimerase-like enolase superfamily enzyme
MELHVALACGVPNGQWVEHIPQLETITSTQLEVRDGYAYPSPGPGIGIAWDWDAIQAKQLDSPILVS